MEEIKMGWRGHEIKIPAGMLFRKMYCAKCGEKLQRQKQSKIIKKGEEGFHRSLGRYITIGMTEIKETRFVYICPKCSQITTYDEQLKISKRQKQLRKKILND